MPPAAKAGCCKSDQLSSYKGHRYPPQAATVAHRPPDPELPRQPKQPWRPHDSSSQGRMLSYLLIGATVPSHRLPQGALGRPTPSSSAPTLALKLMLSPAQECQLAHLGTLATPAEPKWHQSLPRSDPSEPQASKMEPTVIAILAKNVPVMSDKELQSTNPR